MLKQCSLVQSSALIVSVTLYAYEQLVTILEDLVLIQMT